MLSNAWCISPIRYYTFVLTPLPNVVYHTVTPSHIYRGGVIGAAVWSADRPRHRGQRFCYAQTYDNSIYVTTTSPLPTSEHKWCKPDQQHGRCCLSYGRMGSSPTAKSRLSFGSTTSTVRPLPTPDDPSGLLEHVSTTISSSSGTACANPYAITFAFTFPFRFEQRGWRALDCRDGRDSH